MSTTPTSSTLPEPAPLSSLVLELQRQLNDPSLLPHQETLTRIRLADVLLGGFGDIEGALPHLERAVRATLIIGEMQK